MGWLWYYGYSDSPFAGIAILSRFVPNAWLYQTRLHGPLRSRTCRPNQVNYGSYNQISRAPMTQGLSHLGSVAFGGTRRQNEQKLNLEGLKSLNTILRRPREHMTAMTSILGMDKDVLTVAVGVGHVVPEASVGYRATIEYSPSPPEARGFFSMLVGEVDKKVP